MNVMLMAVLKQGNRTIYNLFDGWDRASRGNGHYRHVPGYIGKLSSSVYLFEEVREVLHVLHYHYFRHMNEFKVFRVEELGPFDLEKVYADAPTFKAFKTASKEGSSDSPSPPQ